MLLFLCLSAGSGTSFGAGEALAGASPKPAMNFRGFSPDIFFIPRSFVSLSMPDKERKGDGGEATGRQLTARRVTPWSSADAHDDERKTSTAAAGSNPIYPRFFQLD
jgi:hypothetical protein